jgi:hypothetical protein
MNPAGGARRLTIALKDSARRKPTQSTKPAKIGVTLSAGLKRAVVMLGKQKLAGRRRGN